MEDENGNFISDAMLVQQKIKLYTTVPLAPNDMLRKKNV